MAHVKIIDPSGWNFDRPIAQMIKVSRRGLVGQDRSDFIKCAGATAPAILHLIDGIKVAQDEMPVHLLAMGATEFYGPNRNGDGFKVATCRKHHKTFEKFARWYRNHINKDPRLSYGTVKLSMFNEPMKRIELITMLNADKSAAARNGGFVADKELEKLARGEDIAVSMACRVPYDVCSSCGNKARTRDEYCKAATCKYGGCFDNLTKLAEDGHILHVDNPDPLWFDISNVYRPADRIAYGTKADFLQKAASHAFLPGTVMAQALDITAPLDVILGQDEPHHWNESILGQLKLARGLALYEQRVDLNPAHYRGIDPAVQNPVSDEQFALLGVPGTEKCSAALAALADHKVVLPLRDFARWLGKVSSEGTARLLPGVYTQLIETDALESFVTRNPFAVSHSKTASLAQRTLAKNLVADFSLATEQVHDRAMRSSLRTLNVPALKTGFWNQKQAADEPESATLARQYALYKLAALHRIASFDGDFKLTARLVVGQNRIM